MSANPIHRTADAMAAAYVESVARLRGSSAGPAARAAFDAAVSDRDPSEIPVQPQAWIRGRWMMLGIFEAGIYGMDLYPEEAKAVRAALRPIAARTGAKAWLAMACGAMPMVAPILAIAALSWAWTWATAGGPMLWGAYAWSSIWTGAASASVWCVARVAGDTMEGSGCVHSIPLGERSAHESMKALRSRARGGA